MSPDEGVSTRSNSRGQINSFRSSGRSGTAAIGEQADASIELEEQKQRLASAKRLFKRLARSYLKKRAPPDTGSVKGLWEYKDVLDLETVFSWRDEAGIKRGVLYEDGKVEFEEWPIRPHEQIADHFENVFKAQFVFGPWLNLRNPTFVGNRSSGKRPIPS